MALTPAALAPLRNRDYRLLFMALAISLTGDGIWLVALAFQVIELGGGPVELSLVAACFSIGLLGFLLIGGIVADRLPRRRVMITADLVRAAVVAVVAFLSLSGGLEIWMLGAAGFVVGAGESFFIPSYTRSSPASFPRIRSSRQTDSRGRCGPLRSTPPALPLAELPSPRSLLAPPLRSTPSPSWHRQRASSAFGFRAQPNASPQSPVRARLSPTCARADGMCATRPGFGRR